MIQLSSINLAEFVSTWYGPPDRPGNRASGCEHLPDELRDWHNLAATYSTRLLGIKKFLAPSDIRLHSGKLVFLVDPSDAIWGFDPDDPKSVYEGRLYGSWRKLSESFSEFLVHTAIGEAAHNAPHTRYCGAVNNSTAMDILAPMTEVAIGVWNWPDVDHRLFMGQGIIAEVGPAIYNGAPLGNRGGFSEFQVGAVTSAALDYLEDIPGTEWQ
ncbi:hypothetical protein [Streptomyces werraensis]|uniref:hypothetical protein n=1 Tax=Streptomyces werraensis TaxID=68284 RepID=UPI0036F73400